MPFLVDGIELDELTADPTTPPEGAIWYNTTLGKVRGNVDGVIQDIIDQTEFDAHALSTTNPHTTTLEQARTAGNTLAGDINMGNNTITDLADPVNPQDAATLQWTTDQIEQKLGGLEWQESVLSRSDTPPGSPVIGDRYLVIATATGAWAGQEDNIAEWNGTSWDFFTPSDGWVVVVDAEDQAYLYDGSAWVTFSSTVDHSQLLNLGADDHLQYLRTDGARVMTGDLNVGGNDITNVGLVDGVDVPDHSARHDPGGADALTTAAAVGIDADSTNTEGTGTAFARNDHTHAIDTATGTISTVNAGDTAADGTAAGLARKDHQHAVATAAPSTVSGTTVSNAEGVSTSLARADHEHRLEIDVLDEGVATGLRPTLNFEGLGVTVTDDGVNDRVNISIPGGTSFDQKAGRVANGSFAGNPKKATVTFNTAFASANYAVTATAVTSSNKTFAVNVESQTAGSFVLNAGANNISNLVQVNWVAVEDFDP
jgi:hypothetical protein